MGNGVESLSLDFYPFSRDDGVMVLLLTLILGFPFFSSAYGQAPVTRYYHYDGKVIFLQNASFRRYVIPQLKNMLRDYERLLQKLEPQHEGLIFIRRRAVELAQAWERMGNDCGEHFFIECRTKYREIYALGRSVDQLILRFQHEKISFETAKVDEMMTLSVEFGELQRSVVQILHYLEKGMIFGGSGQYNHRYFSVKINPLVKDLKFFSNTVMTGFLSKEDKKLFDFVWDNFFLQLEYYVVNKGDREYLLRHLEELNISWHTFHMKMTKGFRKYPKSVDVVCSILNKRWNSILKIILNTKRGG